MKHPVNEAKAREIHHALSRLIESLDVAMSVAQDRNIRQTTYTMYTRYERDGVYQVCEACVTGLLYLQEVGFDTAPDKLPSCAYKALESLPRLEPSLEMLVYVHNLSWYNSLYSLIVSMNDGNRRYGLKQHSFKQILTFLKSVRHHATDKMPMLEIRNGRLVVAKSI